MRQLLIVIEEDSLTKFNKKLQEMSDDGWVWGGQHFVIVINEKKHYSIMMMKSENM